jgi:hypothetical protein
MAFPLASKASRTFKVSGPDLPSLKVKDTAVGTALHEFAESYFPQYLAYR